VDLVLLVRAYMDEHDTLTRHTLSRRSARSQNRRRRETKKSTEHSQKLTSSSPRGLRPRPHSRAKVRRAHLKRVAAKERRRLSGSGEDERAWIAVKGGGEGSAGGWSAHSRVSRQRVANKFRFRSCGPALRHRNTSRNFHSMLIAEHSAYIEPSPKANIR
jgi:hypothetical protein